MRLAALAPALARLCGAQELYAAFLPCVRHAETKTAQARGSVSEVTLRRRAAEGVFRGNTPLPPTHGTKNLLPMITLDRGLARIGEAFSREPARA
jgi:hypothetical protein